MKIKTEVKRKLKVTSVNKKTEESKMRWSDVQNGQKTARKGNIGSQNGSKEAKKKTYTI